MTTPAQPTPTLSCVNLKGGVGKTALAVNFAAFCGLRGLRTLLVDLDPQTNATFSCIAYERWSDHAARHGTVADLLGVMRHTAADGTSKPVESVILKNVFDSVDLIPSHQDLFTVDLDMAGETARETKLKRAIKSIVGNYDMIVCDCPPNLTIPTQNALAISTHYAIPVSPDFLSGIGIGLLLTRIRKLGEDLEVSLTSAGIVISRVGRKAEFREASTAAIREQFGGQVLTPEIKERVTVAAGTAQNKHAFACGDSDAAAEFRAVCTDLLNRMGVAQ